MHSIPKLEAVNLLERYNLLSSGDRANEVLLQRLKNEAEEVVERAGHYPEDYEALGCIYAFMNKEEAARRTFYYALSKFPSRHSRSIEAVQKNIETALTPMWSRHNTSWYDETGTQRPATHGDAGESASSAAHC